MMLSYREAITKTAPKNHGWGSNNKYKKDIYREVHFDKVKVNCLRMIY